MATYVFISYMHQDDDKVDRICETLQAAGVDIWRDKDRIAPGMRWEDSIRQAISQGAFFIACFSKNYWERTSTVMNEELDTAIAELAKRHRNQAWFIPLRLDDCDIPKIKIGHQETLLTLQYVDLFRDWADGMRRILMTLAPYASSEYREEAQRWIAEEFRINRALQVYDEWHTPLLHESRIQVSNFLELVRERKISKLPTLSELETAQREDNFLSPYADHFFRVIHYYERWALLHADNLLDHPLCARLLGSYVNWYRDRLLSPLQVGETNPDFVNLLLRINAMATTKEIQEQIPQPDTGDA